MKKAWTLRHLDGELQLPLTVTVENVGNSIAHDVRVIGSLWLPGHRNGKFEEVPEAVHVGMTDTPTYLFPGDKEDFHATGTLQDLDAAREASPWAKAADTDLPLLAAVTVSYRLAYDQAKATRRVTELIFAVYANVDGLSPIARPVINSQGVKLATVPAQPQVT